MYFRNRKFCIILAQVNSNHKRSDIAQASLKRSRLSLKITVIYWFNLKFQELTTWIEKTKPALLKSVLFSCSSSNFKHVVSIQRHLRGHNKITMHSSKSYKLFINPTLAYVVWLTVNVHKPSKAGEQQDDPQQRGQPRTRPPSPSVSPGQHRVHEYRPFHL